MTGYAAKLRAFEYTEVLGWSYSRYDTFEQCKRMYYYQYYGKRDMEHDIHKINFLKNLTSLPLEIGSITHNVIQRLLKRLQKTDDPINLEKFFDYAEKETLNTCSQKNFEELYYKQRDSIDFKLEVYTEVSKALENFLQSDRCLFTP